MPETQQTNMKDLRAALQQLRDEQHRCEDEGHREDALAWRDEADCLQHSIDDIEIREL